MIVPLRSSSRATGDCSRLELLDEFDRELGGRLWDTRCCSVGVPECELDFEFPGFLCEIRGNSVGVSE